MVSIHDRLKRLETESGPSRAERWRADMERARQDVDRAARRLCTVIDQKLAESGIDPDHLPPQTPEEHAESKRQLLQALRAHIID
jgi:hypothetical protein